MKDRRTFVLVLGVAIVCGLALPRSAQTGKATNLTLNHVKWEPAPGSPMQVGVLWGDPTKGPYGMYLRFPAGFEAGWHSHTADYHAVAVQGIWVHTNQGGKPVELGPGAYVMQPGKQVHNDSCKGPGECIIFIHQTAPSDFIPAKK